MLLGKSQRDKEEIRVASVAVYRDGKILFLRRADNHKWTLPGGRLEHGEEPLEAAARELKEETGLEGKLHFLGDELVPGKSLRIYAFTATIAEGTPTAEGDPDEEAEDFDWFPEAALPDKMSVPNSQNVTLMLLDLVEWKRMAKADPEWRAKDGLRLPKLQSPARAAWNKNFNTRLVDVFGRGDTKRLKPMTIPMAQIAHKSSGNIVKDKDRHQLYRRMLAGGDKLPPIVVRKNGIMYDIIDGSHRVQAALDHGKTTHLDAFEMVEPVKKSEHDLQDLTNLLVPKLTNDLRRTKYQHHPNHLAGHCYVASEALFHMLGGPDSGWVPQNIQHEGDSHWYLKHSETKEILDPTAGQFKTKVPYEKGRGKGFLTKEPSKRAAELISRVKTQKALLPAPDLTKSEPEALLKGLMRETAFRHRKTGEVVPSGAFHNVDLVHHWMRRDFEEGYLDHGGKFLNRDQAQEAQLAYHRPDLAKGLGGALMAGALTMGGATPPPAPAQPAANVQPLEKPWTPDNLHQDLLPIAHLESSFGKNVKHEKNKKGEFHTAYGALGLKPVTAHEEYLKTPKLQELYPELKDPADFMRYLKSDTKFYNLTASAHFSRLKRLHGSAEKAAFAWRWGHGAANAAHNDQIHNDIYVQKYRHMATQNGLLKAERYTLEKMAIKDIKPGTPEPGRPHAHESERTFDYSHLISSPVLRRKYGLRVRSNGAHMKAILLHKDDPQSSESEHSTSRDAGYVEGGVDRNKKLNIDFTTLRSEHHGKGLGKAMYLALMTHAYHVHGSRAIEGSTHSSMAHRVHSSISEEHNLGYKPQWGKPKDEAEPFDDNHGPYEYPLK